MKKLLPIILAGSLFSVEMANAINKKYVAAAIVGVCIIGYLVKPKLDEILIKSRSSSSSSGDKRTLDGFNTTQPLPIAQPVYGQPGNNYTNSQSGSMGSQVPVLPPAPSAPPAPGSPSANSSSSSSSASTSASESTLNGDIGLGVGSGISGVQS